VGGSDVTITKPSGLAAGDLLIFIGWSQRANNRGFEGAGDGWSTIVFHGGNNSMDTWLQAMWKIADSTDAAASDFSFATNANADYLHGALLRVTGHDPWWPIDLNLLSAAADKGNTSSTAVASLVAASGTPNPADEIVTGDGLAIAFALWEDNADAATWSITGTGWDSTPYVETIAVDSTQYSGVRATSGAVAWKSHTPGSAISLPTFAHGGTNDSMATGLIYVRPDQSPPDLSPFTFLGSARLGANRIDSAVTLYFAPATLAAGSNADERLNVLPVNDDLLVAVKTWYGSATWDDAAAGVPTGWTSLGQETVNGNSTEVMYWKASGTPAEGDTVVFPASSTFNAADYSIDIVHLRGQDTTTPIDVEGTLTLHSGASNDFTGGDVTTTQANCLVMRIAGFESSSGVWAAAPSSGTLASIDDIWGSQYNGAPGIALELQASAGACGTARWQGSEASQDGWTKTIAWAPA